MVGFFIGMFVGVIIGVVIISACVVSKESEEEAYKDMKREE